MQTFILEAVATSAGKTYLISPDKTKSLFTRGYANRISCYLTTRRLGDCTTRLADHIHTCTTLISQWQSGWQCEIKLNLFHWLWLTEVDLCVQPSIYSTISRNFSNHDDITIQFLLAHGDSSENLCMRIFNVNINCNIYSKKCGDMNQVTYECCTTNYMNGFVLFLNINNFLLLSIPYTPHFSV